MASQSLAVPLIQGASSVLGSVLGGSATPLTAMFEGGNTSNDASGWTVATGRASATGAPATAGNTWLIVAIVGAAAVLGILAWKK